MGSITYTAMGSKDDFCVNEFDSLDLDKVASIEVDSNCVEPCQHFCTFHLEGNEKFQDYQTAEQIIALYKTSKDKISTQVPNRHWNSREVCVIQ